MFSIAHISLSGAPAGTIVFRLIYKPRHAATFNSKARYMNDSAHRIAIIGAGGHGAVVADAVVATCARDHIRIFDAAPPTATMLGMAVIEGSPSPIDYPPTEWRVLVAIGANAVRQQRAEKLRRMGYRGAAVLHPTAAISKHATIGEGVVVMAGAIVNARAFVGEGCIVNSGAIVEHDARLEPFTHLSPGAVVAGGARVGHRCWIGANAVVKQGVRIGDDIVLGALAFAHADLSEPGTYVGIPARPIQP